MSSDQAAVVANGGQGHEEVRILVLLSFYKADFHIIAVSGSI